MENAKKEKEGRPEFQSPAGIITFAFALRQKPVCKQCLCQNKANLEGFPKGKFKNKKNEYVSISNIIST